VFDRKPQRTHLLRARGGDGHARVTSVELFFDLVFVFAVTQLSHLLRRPGVDGGDSARVSRGLRQQRRDVVDLFRYRRRAGQPADRALRRPGRLGRLAYTYVHILIVMGIIVAAVADELILAHPAGHTELKLAAAVLGGPVLFVAGSLAALAAGVLVVVAVWETLSLRSGSLRSGKGKAATT
jgi:low temperature requirement protein LtrA